MPDLGIGEGLAALFGGGDLLAGLFGGGEAAAGAAAADTAAAVGGLADVAGPTAFGTASAFLDPAAAAAGSLAGPTFAGTVADTLAPGLAAGVGGGLAAAPAGVAALDSSVFSTGTNPVFNSSGISDVVGGAGGATPGGSSISSLLNANAGPVPSGAGGTSVFNTGTTPLTGVSGTGAPSAVVPGGGGAAGVAAPSSVAAPADATAAGVPGAVGPTSLNGAPLGAAPPSSIQQLLTNAVGGAEKSLTSNPFGIALGAGGLAYNVLEGQKQTANTKALTADANQATANSNQLVGQGEALQQYLTSGTLPPQYMAQVTQALQDAKTAAISNAAAQGQPTDPTQNTSLAATLAKIDQQEPEMISQIAATLATSGQGLITAGQSAANLSGSLYSTLVNNDTTSAANTGKAIATLAAALNGKSSNTVGGTNITVSPG